MSGLLFLNSDDFYVTSGTKGDILCNTIPGFSLILFYSTQCQFCQKLIPIFKKLPGTIGGCQFGMINVSANKKCIQMAKNTVAPITYVPYIILYVNSRPFMRYSGPNESGEIRRFVFEVAQKVNNKQKFTDDKNVKEDVRGGIPAYTIGHPLYGEDGVSYLEFDTAYDKNSGNKAPGGGGSNNARSAQQSMVDSAMAQKRR